MRTLITLDGRSGTRTRMRVWAQIHHRRFTELAEKTGTSKQAIDSVAAGRYRSGDVVEAVAKEMGCTVLWLTDGRGPAPAWWSEAIAGEYQGLVTPDDKIVPAAPEPQDPDATVPAPISRNPGREFGAPIPVRLPDREFAIPFAGQVTAGGGYADPSQDGDDWLPVQMKPHWRLVRVQGTSAVPVLLSGQAAIVDGQLPVRDGRMVCVQTHDGRAYLKRWNTVGEHVVLAGLNGGHESLVLERSQIAKVAVVVGTLYVDSVAR